MSWTDEQLADLRTYAAEHRTVDSACALSLIDEVERLRDTVKQRDATAAEQSAAIERLREKLRVAEAEVERLREKCDDLTVNGFRVNLKQLDEAKKEIERLQAEVKRLKEVVAGYFGAGQRIQDLSDDCGLLEESNKTLRAEVERLRGAGVPVQMVTRESAGLEAGTS